MKDYKRLLFGFISGGKKEENYIRKVVQSLVSPSMELSLKRKFGDDYEEEIISELRLRFINQKDYLHSLEYVNLQYLRTLIRNLLIDTINGTKVQIYSLQEQVFEEEDTRRLTYEDILRDTRDAFMEAEGNTLFEALLKKLREEDVPVLCYYFLKHFYHLEVQVSGISKDNLYKRWERLRKGKLKEVLNGASAEEVRVLVERFLSEVCEKRGFISNNKEKGHEPGT